MVSRPAKNRHEGGFLLLYFETNPVVDLLNGAISRENTKTTLCANLGSSFHAYDCGGVLFILDSWFI